MRKIQDRSVTRANKKLKQQEERLDRKNIFGFSDYTPYNAITGNDLVSAGRVSDPEQKLPGGFNTTKK